MEVYTSEVIQSKLNVTPISFNDVFNAQQTTQQVLIQMD